LQSQPLSFRTPLLRIGYKINVDWQTEVQILCQKYFQYDFK
jgi:hypothetical protein